MLEEKDLQAVRSMIDASAKGSENRMMAYFDAAILPKFDLLADGQKAILAAVTPKSEIEELKNEISVLKLAVRTMSQEIAELKKAQ